MFHDITQQRCTNSRQTRKVNAPMRILVSRYMVVVNLHDLVFSIGMLNLYPYHRHMRPPFEVVVGGPPS